MDKIRWGILGTGAIAEKMAPAIRTAANSELIGVAGRHEESGRMAAAKYGLDRTYRSYDELIGDPDIDAVYVALLNHLHAEWTIRAIEAGKHVLCEKPMTMNEREVAVPSRPSGRPRAHPGRPDRQAGIRAQPFFVSHPAANPLRQGMGRRGPVRSGLLRGFLEPLRHGRRTGRRGRRAVAGARCGGGGQVRFGGAVFPRPDGVHQRVVRHGAVPVLRSAGRRGQTAAGIGSDG